MQLHNNIKLIKKFQQVALQVKLFQSRNVLKRNRSHADSIFLRQDTSRLVNSQSFKKTPQKFCLFGYELIVEFNVKRFCNCKCHQENNQYNLVRNCEDRNVIPYLFIYSLCAIDVVQSSSGPTTDLYLHCERSAQESHIQVQLIDPDSDKPKPFLLQP